MFLYIYVLYIRGIYLLRKDIIEQIHSDYYHYSFNKWQWLLNNRSIYDVVILIILFVAILLSLYLLYKKSRYFCVVILFPIFLGLALIIITPLYMLLN